MPATNAMTESEGLQSRGACRDVQRAAGSCAPSGKKGAKKADGLQAVLDSIAAMAPEDRALAERVRCGR